VVTPSKLKKVIEAGRDWVVVGAEGDLVDLEVPADVGPAALLVTSVTDALKTVSEDGLVVGAPRRDGVWQVEAFVLNRVLVAALPPDVDIPGDLFDAVEELGFGWQVRPLP
jgi:hypothetical protein